RRVLGHLEPARHRGADGPTARVPEDQRRAHVAGHEYLLDRRHFGAKALHHLGYRVEDDPQPLGEITAAGANARAVQAGEHVSLAFHHAETHDTRARID